MTPGQIIVTHKKAPVPEGFTPFYVGRPSPLGNPFAMKNEADRARVIENFALHLSTAMCGPTKEAEVVWALAERVKAGENLALQCWCAPKPCHAEVVRDWVLWCLKPEVQP